MNDWINHLYSAFIVYCYTPKALYNHVGGSLLNHHQCAASTLYVFFTLQLHLCIWQMYLCKVTYMALQVYNWSLHDMHSLEIEPMASVLLVPCFTYWTTGNWAALCHSGKGGNVAGNHLWAGAGWKACRTRQRWAQHESPSRWATVSQAHPSQSLPSPNNQTVLVVVLSFYWPLAQGGNYRI